MKNEPPIRLLTAVPICDGHDSAINTINLELVHHGIEVIYLGYHRSARDIVRAAVQEDVCAVGISSYNGGHVEFFAEVIDRLRAGGANEIHVFGGGGGTITPADAARMRRTGVDRVFFAGTPLEEIVAFLKHRYDAARRRPGAPSRQRSSVDREIARRLTSAEEAKQIGQASRSRLPRIIGITGTGGAGKTTLIDELVLRFLVANPRARVAVLSHDPSIVDKGALLGDRAMMIHCQDDRVFVRSMATRGEPGGLSAATERALRVLSRSGFDLVLVESVGIGQEAMPFRRGLVDQTVLVMSPDYGSRLQLQKIVMLDVADVVVVNKSDLPGAKTAAAEIGYRLSRNRRGQKVVATVARRHRDEGVDELFALVKP